MPGVRAGVEVKIGLGNKIAVEVGATVVNKVAVGVGAAVVRVGVGDSCPVDGIPGRGV